jgi:hypothetical protein
LSAGGSAAIHLLERSETVIYENILDGHLPLEALKRNNDPDRLRRENTFSLSQGLLLQLYQRKRLATSFSPSFTVSSNCSLSNFAFFSL